ncbi:hypothetical protein ZEAMMB73_Zm00001d053662 [Zea mays]|uniref:Pectin lyase-like superfamily protein n=1 Tax=Zea mays TaxID=4577 RepID=A0A1D6QRB8_MAIZE|nr:hypothetical protein ZEAMMB73_Zm00001d053662 [Zea mays]
MAFISSAAMKAAVAALLVFAAVSPAARAVAAEAEAKAKAVGGAPSVPAGSLDIAQLGAKGDGKSDSTPMVLKAWKHACEATGQQKIIIDQKYCPNNICVKSGASKVAVNDVVFKNIHGTSNTPEAITLNCANNLPCQGVQLINVDIKYNRSDNKTMSVCKNAIGKSIGMAKELACV